MTVFSSESIDSKVASSLKIASRNAASAAYLYVFGCLRTVAPDPLFPSAKALFIAVRYLRYDPGMFSYLALTTAVNKGHDVNFLFVDVK